MLTILDMMMTARAMTMNLPVTVQLSNEVKTASAMVAPDGTYAIVLPAVAACKDAVLPVLRGYLDHEIGHVLYTSFPELSSLVPAICSTFQPSVVRPNLDDFAQLVNLFEDLRIEKRMSEAFPGARVNLAALNRKLFTEDAEQHRAVIAEKRLNVLRGFHLPQSLMWLMTSYLLQHGYATLYNDTYPFCDTLTQALQDIFGRVTPPATRTQSYLDELHAFIPAAMACTSVADAGRCAREFYEFFLSFLRDMRVAASNGEDSLMGENEDIDSRGNRVQLGTHEMGLGSPKELRDAQENGDASDQRRAQLNLNAAVMHDGSLALHETGSIHDKGNAMLSALAAQSLSEEELEQLPEETQERMAGMHNLVVETYGTQCLPETKTPLRTIGLPARYERAAQAAAQQMRSRLGAVLETMTYQRCRTGYTGRRLETSRLYRARLCDGRLYRTNAERAALKTDVALLLDLSGSMDSDDRMYPTCAAVKALTKAMRALPHVRTACYSFNSFGVFTMFGWNEQMPAKLPVADGSTPTGAAILHAMQLFPDRAPDTRRIIMVLTDGAPDDVDSCVSAIRQAEHKGYEVYMITVGRRYDLPNYEVLYNMPQYCWCPAFEQLPAVLYETMQTALRADARAVRCIA